MPTLTITDLVGAIDGLPKGRQYDYLDPAIKNKILLDRVTSPDGPIYIKLITPSDGAKEASVRATSISTTALRRYAAFFQPHLPINADRVFGGSYNIRSALESLLAHTPQFYFCYPGRIEVTTSSQKIKTGHKHLMWMPNSPHATGITQSIETNMVISEIPTVSAVYEAIAIPDLNTAAGISVLPPEVRRRHAQIQVALVKIGQELGFRTWVAKNDQGISYQGRPLIEMDGVIADLQTERVMRLLDDAIRTVMLIDCIWFKNGNLMPAVIEIEHSTGVTSGLARMQALQSALPSFQTRYVIAAPDEDRDKVLRECNREQFKDLKALYLPYSAVDELYSLCVRRNLHGVTEKFLDSFMEPTNSALTSWTN